MATRQKKWVIPVEKAPEDCYIDGNNRMFIRCRQCTRIQLVPILKGLKAAERYIRDLGWRYFNSNERKGPRCPKCQERKAKRILGS